MMRERKVVLPDEDRNKENISYSRDYRHINRNLYTYILQILFILGPIIFGYLLTYSKLSYHVSSFVANILETITGTGTGITKVDYFPKFGGVYCVTMQGKSPSFTLSFVSLIITLMAIIVCSLIKTDKKPVMIFITIGLYIHLVSSAYFVLFGADKFPYDVNSYSILYMKQQIIVWLMIMIIYWLSTSLITNVSVYRILTFIMVSVISFAFGVIRYIVYMVIIAKGSYLFMAVLYFTFGVLFDFMIMVGVYSIFMKYASKKFKKKKEGGLWKWS